MTSRGRTDKTRRERIVAERMVGAGAMLGRTGEGQAVLLRGVIAGEVVEGELQKQSGSFWGTNLHWLEESPERRTPPCAFAARCGGCDFMHMSEEEQQRSHREMLSDALGGLKTAPPTPTWFSVGNPWHYRARARLHARVRRGTLSLGYRAAGAHDIVDVDTCKVLAPVLDAALGIVRRILAGAVGEGEVLLAFGARERPALAFQWEGELGASFWADLHQHVDVGALSGARVSMPGATKPIDVGDPRPVFEGLGDAPLWMPAGGFSQTSEAGVRMLRERVQHHLGPKRARRGLELFAGAGALTLGLVGCADKVTAVEMDAPAAEALRANLRAAGMHAKVVTADAETFEFGERPDWAVLDPPRSGARQAVTRLAQASTPTIVYVSCDPSTLGRDLIILEKHGYGIEALDVLTLFPQTSHVETIAALKRRRS